MERLSVLLLLILLTHLITASADDITASEYSSLPSLFHQDNYDECMLLENETLYCSLSFTLEPIITTHVPDIWKVIKKVSSNPANYRHDILRHGICVPKACPQVDITKTDLNYYYLNTTLTQCYNEKYERIGLKGSITDLECGTNEPKYPLDWFDISLGILAPFYVGFVLLATFWKGSSNTSMDKILAAFSLSENWKKLTYVEKNPKVEKLCVIQLIRIISTFLVIVTHNGAFLGMLPIANVKWIENVVNVPILVIIAAGASSFDSLYMMMAIFLLFYEFLEYTKNLKEPNLNLLFNVFFKRAVRLSPLIVIVLFQASWFRHMGDGPYWNRYVGGEYLRCRKYGWANMVFLNSYVPFKNECLHITWHTSNEMQYLVLLLPLMYYNWKYPKRFWWILGILIPLQMVVTFCQNYLYGFHSYQLLYPEAIFDLNMSVNSEQFRHQHTSLVGNFAGPLIGLVLGKAYWEYRDRRFFTKQVHVVLWWLGALLLPLFIAIPGVLTCLQIEESLLWSSVYSAVSRVVLCAGLAMVIFAFGQGVAFDLIKKCALFPPIYVAGRLAYSVFLVHYPIIYLKVAMSRFPYYLNGLLMTFEVLSNTFLSYLIGIIFSLLFEAPIYRISRLFQVNSNLNRKKEKSG